MSSKLGFNMSVMKIFGRLFPSLYLRTLKTEDLQEAYELADRCCKATLTADNWIAYRRMVKSRNRIQEEIIRRRDIMTEA